jgi:hypothetical protein
MRSFFAVFFLACLPALGAPVRHGSIDRDAMVETNGVTAEAAAIIAGEVVEDVAAVASNANAHAASAHGVTSDGGFTGGVAAFAREGGSIGFGSSALWGGGALGKFAQTSEGGAVGLSAYAIGGGGSVGDHAYSIGGGAVGTSAKTSIGFAGGFCAFATDDGTAEGEGIDAIQLGFGGNSTPRTLQIYENTLLNADGTIPPERIPDAVLRTSGGTMGGLLTLAESGLKWQGSGINTNYTVKAEFDGTNISFNVYMEAKP